MTESRDNGVSIVLKIKLRVAIHDKIMKREAKTVQNQGENSISESWENIQFLC
jgi:hypothetical protein